MLKLPKIAWPSPFNALISGHPRGLTLGNPQALKTKTFTNSTYPGPIFFHTTLTSVYVYYTGLYTQSPQSGSFIFKIATMLQIQRVFPCVSCFGSARWAVQYPWPGPKIGDKSQQIPCYSPVCPHNQPLGKVEDKCISLNWSSLM